MQKEIEYKGMNAWVEWVKYSVHALNKSDCYACMIGKLEVQVVPFPFRWTSDSNRMECVLALYQEETAWGNISYKTLSLLLLSNKDKELGLPQNNPAVLRHKLYLLPLKGGGTQCLDFMRNIPNA